MRKIYGMSNGEVLYLGEHKELWDVEPVVGLLVHYGIAPYGVDWLFEQVDLEAFVESALEALEAQVLVEVSGGVADITSPDYIPVELIDYDALEEEEMNNV